MALLLPALLFQSCDCVQIAHGKILDSESLKPVDVQGLKKTKQYQQVFSDSTGFFEMKSISGGIGGCPPMETVFPKMGIKRFL